MFKRSTNDDARKLFIGGLHYNTTEETLKEHFEQWGEVVHCVIKKHMETNKSRGFGFVTYKDVEMVEEALNAKPHTVDGKSVDAKRGIRRDENKQPESQADRKIFVGGIKFIEEDELKEYFSKFGDIIGVSIARDKESQQNRGFGFIEFDNSNIVGEILAQKFHMINGKSTEVKRAMSKQEKEKNSSQNAQMNYGGQYGGNAGWNAYGNPGENANQYGNMQPQYPYVNPAYGQPQYAGYMTPAANYQQSYGTPAQYGAANNASAGGYANSGAYAQPGAYPNAASQNPTAIAQNYSQSYGGGPMRGGGNPGSQNNGPYGGRPSRTENSAPNSQGTPSTNYQTPPY